MVETVVESVMFLVSFLSRVRFTVMVSFMSLLRFTFVDKFLTSTLLVGMVKLALVMFKLLLALTFAMDSFSPKTIHDPTVVKSKINIPNFIYLSISAPVI